MTANGGEQRIMNNLHQTVATALKKTVAAIITPSADNSMRHENGLGLNHAINYTSNTMMTTTKTTTTPNSLNDNNSQFAYDIPASGLMYWSGDGGGRAAADETGSNSDSFEGSGGDVLMHTISKTIDLINSTRYQYEQYDPNETDYSYPCPAIDPATNLSYWNLTCDTNVDYVVPLYGYCMPFLLIVTVLSNSLIVLILSKKNMSTPTNYALTGMAICDMLTVIFPAPGLWYMYTFGNHYKPLHPVSLCLTFSIFNEIMPAICHTASIWLTLALAAQRYIYVCHAPMARTWCTIPRIKRCTLYIVLISILYQSTRFFDRTFYPLTIEWNDQLVEVCHVETSDWVHEYVGENLYFTTFYLFRVLFVHSLPCIILVTLNIKLFAAMRQAQERRKLLFRENRKKECKKLRESNCTTLMLIVVVTVFLIVEIPIAVLQAMHIASQLFVPFLGDYQLANIFITFTNFSLVASYPINFGIYCGMSRQFRETFKEVFMGRLITKKDNSSRYSIVNGPRTCTNTNETVL